MQLVDVHKKVYEDLKTCETLDEAKVLYPEFRDVREASEIQGEKHSLVERIKRGEKSVGAEEFSLLMLKRIYGGVEGKKAIAKEYGTQLKNLDELLLGVEIENMSRPYTRAIHAQQLRQNEEFVQKHAKASAAAMEIVWQNPEYAARMSKVSSETFKRTWRQEGFREARSEEVSFRIRYAWSQMDDIRQTMSELTEEFPGINTTISRRSLSCPISEDERENLIAFNQACQAACPDFAERLSQGQKEGAKLYKELKSAGVDIRTYMEEHFAPTASEIYYSVAILPECQSRLQESL
ncbi:hypothetical protein tpqmel_0354 [Candidatus Gastranaerophilus sp. (ex Termes propinquus)]|nr:hypothetical protein tpqmel_0354 [Candidatus Gastranaerophilus sp. (ex Termes propinquus)]